MRFALSRGEKQQPWRRFHGLEASYQLLAIQSLSAEFATQTRRRHYGAKGRPDDAAGLFRLTVARVRAELALRFRGNRPVGTMSIERGIDELEDAALLSWREFGLRVRLPNISKKGIPSRTSGSLERFSRAGSSLRRQSEEEYFNAAEISRT